MLADDHPDRIQIAFDDHRLVANAGLILPATLGRHLGLPQLVDRRLDLGRAPGRANTGDKVMTLVASALAGGDCIDDADVLRTGGTAGAIGCVVKAPSTLGTFLRSFRWGHVRQLDRVSRELLARAWAAGAGPGDGPLTIDLDSLRDLRWSRKGRATTAGQGAITRCWPWPPEPATWMGLREGRANTARGSAHFLARPGALAGPGDNSRCGPTAASIPTPLSPSAVRWMSASPSPSASLHHRGLPEEDWTHPTGWTAPPTWRSLVPRRFDRRRHAGLWLGGAVSTTTRQDEIRRGH